jgi:SOS response regulatory protein OraA/RecX
MALYKSSARDKQSGPNARKKLLNILLKRPYSVGAARKLLLQHGYEAEAVEDALTWASSLGYLNDENLAERYASSLMESKGIVGQRLRQELYKRGLTAETVDKTLEHYSSKEDENARCLEAVRKFALKASPKGELGDPEIKKLAQKLRRLGYGWGAIYGAFKQLKPTGGVDFPPYDDIDS